MAADNFWSDLLSGGIRTGAVVGLADNIKDQGADARDSLYGLGNEAAEGTQFTPYGVASALGNVSVDDGTVSAELNPFLAATSGQQLGYANRFFNSSAASQAGREQAIYDRIAAMQNPQIERDRLALESRLFSQGRTGVSDARYGGSPEVFAQEKAIQEARNNAAFQAIDQARVQQMQDANIGTQYLQNSFQPTMQLMNSYTPALQTAQMNQAGQIAGQNLKTQLGLGGETTKLNADVTAANLYGGLFDSLANLGGTFGSRIDDAGGLWDYIKGFFPGEQK